MRWRTSWRRRHSRSTYCTHRPNHDPTHKAHIYFLFWTIRSIEYWSNPICKEIKIQCICPLHYLVTKGDVTKSCEVKMEMILIRVIYLVRRFTDFVARLLGVGGSGDADGGSVRRGAGRRTRGEVRHRRRVLQDGASAAQSRQVSTSVCVCVCVCVRVCVCCK